MNKSKVIVLKSNEYSAEKNIKFCLNFFKNHLPKKVKKIAIKLNLCDFKDTESGAVSNPFIVEQLIKSLFEVYGNAELSFVESDTTGRDVKFLWGGIGFDTLAKKYDINMANLSKDEMIKTKIDGFVFKEIDKPKTLAEADLFISHPKLKTHSFTKITCGLKNQFGCLPYLRKEKFHIKIDEIIADANLAFKPDLILVDGILGLGSSGPITGAPKRFNLIIAGMDVVATDCVSARVLGFNPRFVGQIQKAAKKRIGTTKYEIVGIDPKKLRYNIEFSKKIYYASKLYAFLKG